MQLAQPAMADSPPADERTVLERSRAGDVQAFGVVVQRYMRQAYFTALGLVGNHSDALDLSQEAFVRAHRAISGFDTRQRFFTWYYRILRNLCLNHLRNSARRRQVPLGCETPDSGSFDRALIDSRADPSVIAERSDLMRQLWREVAALQPEDREVLVLREIEGCSYAEIAERLEIPRGTVMSRLFYARQRLRERMGGAV